MKVCSNCKESKSLDQFWRGYNYCKTCGREYNKNYVTSAYRRKFSYGLTPEDVAAIMLRQNNACGICQAPLTDRQICIDHDHACCPGGRSCGKCVRGILCRSCNIKLGWLENRQTSITAYLEN